MPRRIAPSNCDDAPDRFLNVVAFDPTTEVNDQMTSLVNARRAAEDVDPAIDDIPASGWLDDPDWRPPGWTGGF